MFYYFNRDSEGNNPSGITVSKTEELPEGVFEITEYTWPFITLWFIDAHEFTADERWAAVNEFLAVVRDSEDEFVEVFAETEEEA